MDGEGKPGGKELGKLGGERAAGGAGGLKYCVVGVVCFLWW